ncbi:MAG: DUF835 domain-containing protein, partial [Thermoplasmata archaeon]
MGNGFNVDIVGIKSILKQIFISQPEFPITDKNSLVRALGGETGLIEINSQAETHSAVMLADAAFSHTQVFHDSNDIIDGIIGGSFANILTKHKIYTEIQELEFPVKHFRDLEKFSTTLELFGIPWEPVKERLDLPINSSSEIILALSATDPALIGTDISLISNLETPDPTKKAGPPVPKIPSPPAAPPVSEGEAPAGAPEIQDEVQPPASPPPKAPAPAPPPSATPPPAPPEPAKVLETEPEPETLADNVIELKFGFSYLMKEDKPKQCFEILSKSLSQGYAGLCITRTNPKQVRKKFNLKDITIHWLTDRKSSEETTLSPALETIAYTVEGFVKKNDKALVLIDGLEYLISVNKFNPVLSFVRRLVDFVSERNAAFLAPISPMTIGEQELKTLEREMEAVGEDEVLHLTLNDNNPGKADEGGASVDAEDPSTGGEVTDTPGSGTEGKSCTPCEGTGRCFWCAGTGNCESCSGSGKKPDGSECGNCNGTGICDSCKGNKECIWCKGTG